VASPSATAVSSSTAELLPILLTDHDLPDGWSLDSAGPASGDDTADSEQICGARPFPRKDTKLGEVEAEFSYPDDSQPVYLYQNLVRFPKDIAPDAMTWARQASDCNTWTSPDGTVFSVTPLEDPHLGSESFAIGFTFDAGEGQTVQGRWVFIRVDGLISTMAYVGAQGTDFSAAQLLIKQAADRMKQMAPLS
jgi:hypothetical protein